MINYDPPFEDVRLRDDGFESWLELYAEDIGLDQLSETEQRRRFERWVRDAQWQDGEDLAQARAEAIY